MNREFDVMIIDDEQVVLEAVAKVGTAHAYKVDVVGDGPTALRRLDHGRYRLVICDIMMPDIDGFQILEAVRSQHPETSVIMTTGYATVDHAVRSLRGGAVGYLAKPFTEEELLSAIHRGLRHPRNAEERLLRKGPPRTDPAGGPREESAWYRLGWISWVRMEQWGSAFVGVTDTFLETVGAVQRVQLGEETEEIVQGTSCARVVSQDGLSHDVLGPISGTIVETNRSLEAEIVRVQSDPCGKGWFYRVIPANPGYELEQLTEWSAHSTGPVHTQQ
ncbi:MAG: response regulator [Bacteroidota bacterium]